MSVLGKIDPAITKKLADQIRAIGKTAKSEEDHVWCRIHLHCARLAYRAGGAKR
ncbi:MAG: hypothetical protein NTY01_21425 [Verrucomicrobia bacterium]|nr:hypothetical protein [Verrucomicrobiota bacterium]